MKVQWWIASVISFRKDWIEYFGEFYIFCRGRVSCKSLSRCQVGRRQISSAFLWGFQNEMFFVLNNNSLLNSMIVGETNVRIVLF